MLTSRLRALDPERFAPGTRLCSFGITEAAIAIGTSLAAGVGAVDTALVGALGTFGAGALEGAALGTVGSAVTGGDPLTGALTGGLTGGAIGGLGGPIGSATGLGAVGGDVIAGAGAGALGAGLTHGNPLTGALTGGASGLAAGLIGGAGGAEGAPGAAGGTSPTGELTTGGAVAPTPDTISLTAAPATGVSGASGAAAPALPGVASAIGGGQPLDLTASVPAAAGAPPPVSVSPLGDAGFPAATLPPISPGAGPGGNSVASVGGTVTPSADASALTGGGAGGGAGLDPVMAGNVAGESLFGSDFTTAPAAGAGGGAAGAAPKPGFVSSGLQDLGVGAHTADLLGKAAGPAIAAGGLGYSLLSAPGSGVTSAQAADATKSLVGSAGTLAAAGTANQSYLQTGTLPPGAQAAVTQATNAAKARLKSQYASLGLTGSTMESQALNNIDSQASAQVFQIGNQLVNTGLTQTQLADQLYQQLIGLNTQQTATTQSAIANLAASLSGGSGKGNTFSLVQA